MRIANSRLGRHGAFFAVLIGFLMAGCGGGGGSSSSTAESPSVGPSGVSGTASLSVLAGSAQGRGSVDGTGAAANFNMPTGLAVDSGGNVFVADTINHTIRKITPAGVVTTFAGTVGVSGFADGVGAAAVFNAPIGIAIDSADNLYVVEGMNYAIRKISPAGEVTTFAGSGTSPTTFTALLAIAIDGNNDLYVSDAQMIRKVTQSGDITTLAGSLWGFGTADGNGSNASFGSPQSLAVEAYGGNVYVADAINRTIRKVTAAGTVTTLAGLAGVPGSSDGTGASATFSSPFGLMLDRSGNLLVADKGNSLIRAVSTTTGAVTTVAGVAGSFGSVDGTGAGASFAGLYGLAPDALGNVYISDSTTLRKMTSLMAVTTIAGIAPSPGNVDATGSAAKFDAPRAVAADSAGNLYVTDQSGASVRKVTPAGVVTTVAATGLTSYWGVAVDTGGNVFVADSNDNVIQKIAPSGTISTFAGTFGAIGSSDGTGTLAKFSQLAALTIDAAGSLYAIDGCGIRKISPSAIVTTLVVTGCGGGTGSPFAEPAGIAVDSSNNLYVADAFNHTISKISPTGTVTTLAGAAGQSGHADGVGSTARFNTPTGIAVDASGNVYVADAGNSTIRKITPAGAVTTVVGVAGVAGFVPGNLPGVISYPGAMAWFGGNLYFVNNNAIVQVSKVP